MHMLILLFVCSLLEEILATHYMKLSGATVIYITRIEKFIEDTFPPGKPCESCEISAGFE